MALEKDQSGENDKVRLSMWLVRRQHSGLKVLAQRDGRTVSDIIRQIVSDYLNGFDSKKKGTGEGQCR